MGFNLGSSSGFGAEVSVKLSEYGVNIIGVHLDRKNTMENVERYYLKSNLMGSKQNSSILMQLTKKKEINASMK